jgi:mono/diheme cytochrome c family protein
MKTSLRMIQYTLYAMVIFALSGCGASDTTTAGMDKAPGKLPVNLVLPKSTGKTVGLAADAVKVRLIVTGAGIPTAKKDFNNNTGGEIEVYPGSNLIVTAQAFDVGGALLYEGSATNVTIVAGPNPSVTIQMTDPVVKSADTACLGCHEATRDITGQNLVADYKQSGHYTNVSWTANAKNGSVLPGCAGCHGTQHNDTAPATSGRCFECHGANLSLKHTSATALVAGDANPARYLNLTGTNCSACHEPHNPINGVGAQQRKDWAESGHGDINAAPWVHYDFTTRDTCNFCHTAAGFAKAVGNNFTDKKALSTTTLGKQPLTCDGCHSSNDFANSVRSVSQFTATYTDAPTQYPNVGASNLCIPCHAGRESGDSIKNSASDFSNTSFKNSHYLAASGIIFSKNGYHYDNRNYDSNIKNDGTANSFRHDDLGVGPTGVAAADAYISANNLNSAGPCVVCHLTSEKLGVKTSHRFSPFTEYAVGDNALNPVCVTCHSTRGAGSNAKVAWFEGQWKVRIDAALDALKDQMALKGIYYNASYPYFYKDPNGDGTLSPDEVISANGYKTWDLAYGAGTGKNTMGTAFNYNLLLREPGAVAHNRYYSRRLIYDAIDWLDDGAMNYSVFATLNALGPDKTYKADAITFLINRGTGDVNVGTEKERY